jgi:hypothetical protein
VARQRLGHVPFSGPKTSSMRVEALGDQPRARSTKAASSSRARLLELRLDEVGVGAGLLAVEHARADRDRVEHEPRGVLAGLLALAREAHRAASSTTRPSIHRRPRACGPGRRGEGWQLPWIGRRTLRGRPDGTAARR